MTPQKFREFAEKRQKRARKTSPQRSAAAHGNKGNTAFPGRVRIYNDLIYAAIHNNGGSVTITPILRNTTALKTEKAQRKATTFSIISAALLERHAP